MTINKEIKLSAVERLQVRWVNLIMHSNFLRNFYMFQAFSEWIATGKKMSMRYHHHHHHYHCISSTMRQQSVAEWLVSHIINQRLGSAGKIDANNNLTPTLRFAQVSLDRRYNRAWLDCFLCIPSILSGSPNRMLATYLLRMCNINLKTRIAGSSSRPQ